MKSDDTQGRARAHYLILYIIQMVSDVIPLLKRPMDSKIFNLEALLVQHIVVSGPKPVRFFCWDLNPPPQPNNHTRILASPF